MTQAIENTLSPLSASRFLSLSFDHPNRSQSVFFKTLKLRKKLFKHPGLGTLTSHFGAFYIFSGEIKPSADSSSCLSFCST